MRDSVPSASYSSVCNVLRQWNISLIESTDSMIMSHSCPNLVSTSFLYNPYIPFLISRFFFLLFIIRLLACTHVECARGVLHVFCKNVWLVSWITYTV